MDDLSFSVSPNEELLDLRLFQCGWEQCAPLHSFGPFVRNHYLFHYVISGQGFLNANVTKGTTRRYDLEPGQGFLISPARSIHTAPTSSSPGSTSGWNLTASGRRSTCRRRG